MSLSENDVAATSPRRERNGRPRQRPRPPMLLWFAYTWMTVLVVLALLAGILPIADYDRIVGTAAQGPSLHGELLGTDYIGRSLLSRLAYGARVSLAVGLIATFVGMLLGSMLGLVAAYFRGGVAASVDMVANTVLAVPPIIFLMAIVSAVKPSLLTLVISLGLLVTPTFARLAKANVTATMAREYVTAAHAMGAGHRRILFRELLPNAMPPVLAYAAIMTASLIVAEGSLGFLGLGIPPPQPSWGSMIAEAQPDLDVHPWPVFAPCIAMFLTVFSLNIIGDRLQRRFNIKEAAL